MHSLSEKTLLAFWDSLESNPEYYSQMLCTLDFLTSQSSEIVVAGEVTKIQSMLYEIRKSLILNKVVAFSTNELNTSTKLIPMLKGKSPINNCPTVYLCQDYSCKEPITDIGLLKKIFSKIQFQRHFYTVI
jgi:uncharacterized protein YyaL (SSP411 family)